MPSYWLRFAVGVGKMLEGHQVISEHDAVVKVMMAVRDLVPDPWLAPSLPQRGMLAKYRQIEDPLQRRNVEQQAMDKAKLSVVKLSSRLQTEQYLRRCLMASTARLIWICGGTASRW